MPLRADSAWRRNWITETPGISCGVLEREEHARLGPLVGRPLGDVVAEEVDRAAGDLVFGGPHQRAAERGLAGAVGPHDRVDLTGVDREVEATQDLTRVGLGGLDVQVVDSKQGGAHSTILRAGPNYSYARSANCRAVVSDTTTTTTPTTGRGACGTCRSRVRTMRCRRRRRSDRRWRRGLRAWLGSPRCARALRTRCCCW